MKLAPARHFPAAEVCPEASQPIGRSYRVLTIAPTSFFGDYGCHVRILEETLALQRRGSQVTICTYSGGRDLPGIDIRRTIPVPGRSGIRIGSSRAKPILDAMLFLRALRVALRHRPDIIHGHLHEGALIGLLLSRLLRVPLVFDFQGSLTSEMMDHNFLSRESRIYGPLRWLEGQLDRRADLVLTSTHRGSTILTEKFGVEPKRVRALPDAVNTDVFAPRWETDDPAKIALRRKLGIPLGRQLVVYLGLLAEYQGATHLLEAAGEILRVRPATHFLLMGYPGQERYLVQAQRRGIAGHITFTGRLPYELAPSHLALGDLAVSPKISLTEGNGKLLNYMAVGLPTVAFDTPVNREILGDSGAFARLGDSGDLARVMIELLANQTAADQRGRLLRLRAEECFSWGRAAQDILNIYEELCR